MRYCIACLQNCSYFAYAVPKLYEKYAICWNKECLRYGLVSAASYSQSQRDEEQVKRVAKLLSAVSQTGGPEV